MEELNLVIRQPEEGKFLTHITWNKDELKAYIEKKVADYQNLVYTDDTIKEAKKDRADLNKLKKQISDRRIEVKKAVMAPYTEFETDVKEVLELIEQPINQIDAQIKAYESDQKEGRKQALFNHYMTYSDEFQSMVPFKSMLSEKMLLASKSEKKAISELDIVHQQIETDLMTIDMGLEERDREYAKQRYLSCFDVGRVFAEMRQIMDRRKAEEDRKAAQAAQEAQSQPVADQAVNVSSERTEGQETANTDAQQGMSAEQSSEPEVSWKPESEQEKVYVTHFTCYGTKAQLYALRDFMVQNGIRFERIANAS